MYLLELFSERHTDYDLRDSIILSALHSVTPIELQKDESRTLLWKVLNFHVEKGFSLNEQLTFLD